LVVSPQKYRADTGRILSPIPASVLVMTTHIPATGHPHSLVSIRVITDDVARLVDFYERVSGMPVRWSTPDFAELGTRCERLGSAYSIGCYRPGSEGVEEGQ
jgi:hypothetical protein